MGRALVPCSSVGRWATWRCGERITGWDGLRSRSLVFCFPWEVFLLTGRRGELYIVFTCPIVFELLLHPESECESSLPHKSSPAPSRRGGHVRCVFGKPVGTAAFCRCRDLVQRPSSGMRLVGNGSFTTARPPGPPDTTPWAAPKQAVSHRQDGKRSLASHRNTRVAVFPRHRPGNGDGDAPRVSVLARTRSGTASSWSGSREVVYKTGSPIPKQPPNSSRLSPCSDSSAAHHGPHRPPPPPRADGVAVVGAKLPVPRPRLPRRHLSNHPLGPAQGRHRRL